MGEKPGREVDQAGFVDHLADGAKRTRQLRWTKVAKHLRTCGRRTATNGGRNQHERKGAQRGPRSVMAHWMFLARFVGAVRQDCSGKLRSRLRLRPECASGTATLLACILPVRPLTVPGGPPGWGSAGQRAGTDLPLTVGAPIALQRRDESRSRTLPAPRDAPLRNGEAARISESDQDRIAAAHCKMRHRF